MEGVPADLWDAAKTAGPFATLLMLFMWWLERTDRVRLQRERDALLERVLTVMNTAATMFQQVKQLVTTEPKRRG